MEQVRNEELKKSTKKYIFLSLSSLVLLAIIFVTVPLITYERRHPTEYAVFEDMWLTVSVLENYHRNHGIYPSTSEGLAVFDATDLKGKRLYPNNVAENRWGVPYFYNSPGVHNPDGYDLWTYGADGKPGGIGADFDMYNWKEDNIEGRLVKHERGVIFVPDGNPIFPEHIKLYNSGVGP